MNIANRLKSHNTVLEDHHVSWLQMNESEIHTAELFYIWSLKPYLNSEVMKSLGVKSEEASEAT